MLLLKVVVIVLLDARLRFSICSSRRDNGLVRHLLAMIAVAVVLDINVIVNVVGVSIAALATVYALRLLLWLKQHFVIVLIALSGIAVSLLRIAIRLQIIVNTSGHVVSNGAACDVRQSSLLRVAALPWLLRGGHSDVGNWRLSVRAIQVVMQPCHATRPRIHLLIKLGRILRMLSHVLCVVQIACSVVSERCLGALAYHVLKNIKLYTM